MSEPTVALVPANPTMPTADQWSLLKAEDELNQARVRFWPKVELAGNDACWLWRGARNHQGYGVFNVAHRRQIRAHRFVYVSMFGPIPARMAVMHTCDTPPCVNPRHLRLGTVAENNKDRAAKGRSACGPTHGSRTHPECVLRGERHPQAKLTEQEVVQLRLERVVPKPTITELARRYGISRKSVRDILSGAHWSHL